MKTAVFRADGSSHIGMGHIMRCLAIAERLKKRGMKPVFLIKALDGSAASLLKTRGIEFEEMPVNVSAEREAALTNEISFGHGASLIVTDICYQDRLTNLDELKKYHCLLSIEHFTLCLTGSTIIDFPCQMIVSPYFRSVYPALDPYDDRNILIGPPYFIFRDEMVEVSRKERTINQNAENILVVIGGSDELGFTAKVLDAIRLLSQPPLMLQIVIGPGYTEKTRLEIENSLVGYGGENVLLNHNTNLGMAMFSCDMAITGDGLLKYETAVTGTPSIMISRYDSEHELDRQFAATGTTLHVGDGALISAAALSGAINDVLDSYNLRARMSKQGKKMLDGRGIERILEKIPMGVL